MNVIDLEQNVVTRRRIRHRGSLVVVEKFDPLKEAVVGDMGEKSLCVGEVVGLHCLTGPTVTSGPAPREPQGGVFVKEPGDDRSLADASWAGDHDDHAVVEFSHRSRWRPRRQTQ